MKKIFVTGADGMLGTHICRQLLAQGYSVKAMVLPQSKSNTLQGFALEIVQGNILDQAFLMEAMRGCDAVIHVAALTTVWPRRMPIIKEVNYTGSLHVAHAVKALGLQRMVHIGTANSFGHGSKENPGNENTPFNAGMYKMDYINSKLHAQQTLLHLHQQEVLPVLIINPTFMIGAYDSGPSSGQMLIGLYNKVIPAYASGGKNFVCAKDVTIAAVNALSMGKTGECYIAGNENLSFKEFFQKAASVMDIPFNLRKAPHAAILLLGAFNSVWARLSRKPPKISFTMARMSGVNQYFSAAKAQQQLQMPQTPIEEGIQECINWFKANGYIA